MRYFLLFASVILPVNLVSGQGPLTPPGPPAATGRSLEQIEPRTPIAAASNLTLPGSYYLTSNITVASGNGISISSDNVTLDLNGFTISSTSPTPSGSGILVSTSSNQVTIRNGHILGTTIFSSGTFSGGGFITGITALTSRNVQVSDVSVSGMGSNGINLSLTADAGTLIRGCTVRTASVSGLRASAISDSAALQIGGAAAIEAGSVSNSVGTLTGAGTPLLSARIAATDGRSRIAGGTTGVVISQPGSYVLDGNITVTSGDAISIDVDNVTLDLNGFTLSSTVASPVSGTGVLLNGPRNDITIVNGHIRGGSVYTGTGATFTEAGFENGITVTNSSCTNILIEKISVRGTRRGIYLSRPNNPVDPADTTLVRFCSVSDISRDGLCAATIHECNASSVGEIAANADLMANTRGTSYGSVGLLADAATNCEGRSILGNTAGLDATVATNSRGIGGSRGLRASQALNCVGQSSAGTGIDAYSASNCFGSTQTGIGISATIGVSCRAFVGSGGVPLQITNRYNMP